MPAPFTHSHNAFRRLLGMPRGRASRLAAAMAVVVIGGCGGVSTLAPGGQQDHSVATTPPVPGAGTRAVVPSTPAPAEASPAPASTVHSASRAPALAALATLPVKGRAAKTGYERELFGQAWSDVDRNGCDTRNDMLTRDLTRRVYDPDTRGCVVLSGSLDDPYTGNRISFRKGDGTLVDIDHVVAMGNAWATGAFRWEIRKRAAFANDPMNLLAVDASANRQKGDGDAATWLPSNKRVRCGYVARQIGVKAKYDLWVTPAEKVAMSRILGSCPGHPRVPDSGVPVIAPLNLTDPSDSPSAGSGSESAEPNADGNAGFGSCDEARAAGAAPVRRGDPGYSTHLDGDGDGVACE